MKFIRYEIIGFFDTEDKDTYSKALKVSDEDGNSITFSSNMLNTLLTQVLKTIELDNELYLEIDNKKEDK